VRGDWSEDTQLPQRGRHERVDDRVTTRFGHTGDNPFELAFWDEMLRSPVLGEMFDACKRTCDNAWPQYALNLLGDPALRVWTDRPRDLEVGIRPFELCVDVDNAVSVSVYASGPVADAVVVVSQNGARLAGSATGANGRAHLTVHPRSTGQVDVAVCGHNLVRVLRRLPVIRCVP